MAAIRAMQAEAALAGYSDSEGLPYAGGSLSIYDEGTTNLATIYADSDKVTPLANPVTLNIRGGVDSPIFIDSNVKIVLKDSGGSTIATWDELSYSLGNFTVEHDTDGTHTSITGDDILLSDATLTTELIKTKKTGNGYNSSVVLTDGTRKRGPGSATYDTRDYRSGTKAVIHDDGAGGNLNNFTVKSVLLSLDSATDILFGSDARIYRSTTKTLVVDDGAGTDLTLFRIRGNVESSGRFYSQGSAASDSAFVSDVSGDAYARYVQQADGKIFVGDGATTPLDTNLYRESANRWKTDDDFSIGGVLVGKTCGINVYRNLAQTILTATVTTVLFDASTLDPDSVFDHINGRYVPTVEGHYTLTSSVSFANPGANCLGIIYITKNGVAIAAHSGTLDSTYGNSLSVSTVFDANGAGDYFEVRVYQNSGGSLLVSAGQIYTFFGASLNALSSS